MREVNNAAAPLLSLKQAEELVGDKAANWHGRCFEIASVLAPHVGGTAVYGHWVGDISAKAKFWAAKKDTGFANHGWVVLPNEHGNYVYGQEVILDPTRWSFEAKKPYLWSGRNDGSYDEGGNKLRDLMQCNKPRSEDPDDNREPVLLPMSSDELYERIRVVCGISWLEEYSEDYPYLAHWDVLRLCNANPHKLGLFFVAEVYEKLNAAGYKYGIPLDNWNMVNRYCKIREVPKHRMGYIDDETAW